MRRKPEPCGLKHQRADKYEVLDGLTQTKDGRHTGGTRGGDINDLGGKAGDN